MVETKKKNKHAMHRVKDDNFGTVSKKSDR